MYRFRPLVSCEWLQRNEQEPEQPFKMVVGPHSRLALLAALVYFLGILSCRCDESGKSINRRDAASDGAHARADDREQVAPLLSEVPECQADIERICGSKLNIGANGKMASNFEVLYCIMQHGESANINKQCQSIIYSHKLNMTRDPRLEAAVENACSSFVKETHCGLTRREGQSGQFVACLMEAAANTTVEDQNCHSFLVRIESIVFSDYHLIHGFVNECEADIGKLSCGLLCDKAESQPLQHNQGCVIECLMENIANVSSKCQGKILQVAEMQADDFALDRPLFYACQEDRERFCAQVASGNGAVYSCLFKYKNAEGMSAQCTKQLTRRQQLIQKDVKVNKGFMGACKKDIQEAQCMDEIRATKISGKEAQLSKMLLCLEKRHFDDTKWVLSSQCLTEVKAVRKSLMEDYQINPEVVAGCYHEIHKQCEGLGRKGKTLHCLMGLARPSKQEFKELLSSECKAALSTLVDVANPVEDPIGIDSLLEADCRTTLEKHCQGTEHSGPQAMRCLMALARNDNIDSTCKQRLMEIEYFVSRNFQLDPELWQACHADVKTTKCDMGQDAWNHGKHGPMPGRLVFSCLHRHMRDQLINHDGADPEGPEQPDNVKLSHECMHQVRRVLHERAASIDLVPELEEACLNDLGKFCARKEVEDGEELDCLQEHLEDLQDECRNVVREALEEQDEDIELDRILARSCKPMLERFCKSVMREEDDEGKVIECLITNKNDGEMDPKCRIGIEHHQITTLKDFTLSFAFKEACKSSALRHCRGLRAKHDVVVCLSEVVRNDTLLESPTQRIPDECRQQLRFELLSETENVMKLNPKLARDCAEDAKKLCSNVAPREGAVLACLQRNQKKLTRHCYKQVFQMQEVDNVVVGGNYEFYHKCKPMLKLFCPDFTSQPLKAKQCLSNHRRRPEFDRDCLAAMDELEIEENTDIRLNPVLRKACRHDIEKYCLKAMSLMQDNEQNRTQALVIQCLRDHYPKAGALTPSCFAQMELLVASMNEDYRKDISLSEKCSKYIIGNDALCRNDDPEEVVECLKAKFTLIKEHECQFEIFRLIAESRVDVRSDPVLFMDCESDVKIVCGNVIEGAGRQMACLIEALDRAPRQLSDKCRTTLAKRKKLWEYSVQFPLPEGFKDVISDMSESPSRWYFLTVALSFLLCILLIGMCCGRVTKRLPVSLKNK